MPITPLRPAGVMRDGERGSATVEAAIAICAVVVVLAMALAGATAVLDQLRCTDAAREAARLVARGEPARAEQAARTIAPSGADVVVRVHGDEVDVQVSVRAAGGLLPGLSVRAGAMAVMEPGAVSAG